MTNIFTLAFVLLLAACSVADQEGPTISAIEPSSVCLDLKNEDPSTGQRFIIRGKGFGTDGGSIDGSLATIEVWRDDFIRAQINMFGSAEKSKITVTPAGGFESENSKTLTVKNGCSATDPGDESYLQDVDDPVLSSLSASKLCRNKMNEDRSVGESLTLTGMHFGNVEGGILGLTGVTVEKWSETEVIAKVNMFEDLGTREIEIQREDGFRSFTEQKLEIVDCE